MLPPDIPVFDAHPSRATASRPVSGGFSATLLAAAVVAVCCGAMILAGRLHHHTRSRIAIRPEWLAPPTMVGREVAKLRQTEDRP